MTLSEWMTKTGTKPDALAAFLGVHPVTVYRWRSGAKMPKPAQMAGIQSATEGLVGPADFYPAHPIQSVATQQTTASVGQRASDAAHTRNVVTSDRAA